jgi:cell division inhibitor SepF
MRITAARRRTGGTQMGFFDEIKKLTQPFDDEEEFFDEDEASTRIPVDKPPVQEKKSSFFSAGGDFEPVKPTFSTRKDYRQDPAKVVSLNTSAQLKVVLVNPERFEAAADIADHLRDKRAVVMNLEQTNKDVARRLIDFLSGVAYAQDGKIKKIAANTYIITPYNVDLVGDLMGELENTGLHF